MIFNNHLTTTNLLGTSYVSSNILFVNDVLYTPLFNFVKVIDLINNRSSILPFETHNQIKNIVISPDGVILIAIDMAGYAIVFNLKGGFTIA